MNNKNMMFPDKFENESYSDFIKRIARVVLNGEIKASGIKPVDVEIYLYDELAHPDDTAHRHPLQVRYNQFYFYRAGKSNSLRPLNRMGVGISFSTDWYSLAILLRGVSHNNQIIRGTSFVARFIYSYFTGLKYEIQTQEERLRGIEEIERMENVLEFDEFKAELNIHQTERTGLNPKRDFACRKYRFYTQ